MSRRISAITSCLLVYACPLLQAQEPKVIHIGIVDSLVKNLSPGKQKILESDFPSMVYDFTGFKSQALNGGDAFTAAKKLADGEWHLGVLQGVEFAWAQEKDPMLKPLMVTIHRKGDVKALLVVGKDSGLSGFADLKGQVVWVQSGKEHCRLFAERGGAGSAAKFFGQVSSTVNVEQALDDILRGKVHGGVVDNASLEDYKEINPGKFKRLQTAVQSESFPMPAIVYRQGMLSDSVLSKFKNGMLKANETEKGRDAMAGVQITAFEAVPPNYGQLVNDILKAYPSTAK